MSNSAGDASSLIGIIGLGLLGGSIAKGLQNQVETGEDLQELLSKVDILILAVPISAILEIGKKICSLRINHPLLVVDIGSVKEEIARQFEAWTNGPLEFVATHPMAGKTESGYEHSDAHLFEDTPWIITPHDKNTEAALEKVEKFIQKLGAHPARMDPKTHDQKVCLVSHLPYLISKALLDFVRETDPSSLDVAGPGFQSTTRLAADNPALRAEIAHYNQKNLRHYLKQYIQFLEKVL